MVSITGAASTITDLRSKGELITDDLLHGEDDATDSNFLSASQLQSVLDVPYFEVLHDEPEPVQIFFVIAPGLVLSKITVSISLR